MNENNSSSEGTVEKNDEEKSSKNTMLKLMAAMFQGLFVEEDTSKYERKLETLDINGVAKYLKSCKNIICLIGAGVSTSAGIPDFRTPNTGLYSQLESYNLPTPESIFDIEFFKTNPQPFFTLSKNIFPSNFQPTLSHYFLKLLHDKGHLLRVYSQNIDMLEHRVGLPDNLILNAHGTFKKGHCIQCNKEYTFEWMKDEIFKKVFLKCDNPVCSDGLVKPDIVFFGESLPKEFFSELDEDFEKCDLLIVMGTSLKVQPFASLVDLVSKNCPRLLINRDSVGNFLFDLPEKNYRDVFLKNDCDDGCLQLAKLLNWNNQLLSHKSSKVASNVALNKTSVARSISPTKNSKEKPDVLDKKLIKPPVVRSISPTKNSKQKPDILDKELVKSPVVRSISPTKKEVKRLSKIEKK